MGAIYRSIIVLTVSSALLGFLIFLNIRTPGCGDACKLSRNYTGTGSKLVTVVTAYYQIPSKHPHEEYKKWIINFLGTIPCNLYVFTEKHLVDELMDIRPSSTFNTRWIVRELSEFKSNVWRETLEKQLKELDQERSHHSSQLYMVWHEKTNFVMDAIKENYFGSEYFIWCDIGSFRTSSHLPRLDSFPDDRRTAEVLHDWNRMALLQIEPFKTEDRKLKENGLPVETFQFKNRIGGGILAGHPNAWNIWEKNYYSVLERWIEAGRFAGKDQSIFSAVAVMFPDTVKLIKPEPYFGDPWFYLQCLFSANCTQ